MTTTQLLPATCRTTQDTTKARIRASIEARKVRRAHWTTREAWLERALEIMRPRFEAVGFPLPEKLTVSVSWAYTRGLADAARVWGQCFPPEASRDGKTTQIGISPWADSGMMESVEIVGGVKVKRLVSMYEEVINTLQHEGIHGAVTTREGHAGKFRSCAVRLGYADSDFETTPLTPELSARFDTWALTLGRYPHTAIQIRREDILSGIITISDGPKPPKPSNARNKYEACECATCGYKARVYTKWLEEQGTPICPCNHKRMERKGTHVGSKRKGGAK